MSQSIRIMIKDLKPGDIYSYQGSDRKYVHIRRSAPGDPRPELLDPARSLKKTIDLSECIEGGEGYVGRVFSESRLNTPVWREEREEKWWDKEDTPLTRLMRERADN